MQRIKTGLRAVFLACLLTPLGTLPALSKDITITVDPSNSDAIGPQIFGKLSAAAGNYEAALKHFKEAHKLDPNNPAHLDSLAITSVKLGLSNDAKMYTDRAKAVRKKLKKQESDPAYIAKKKRDKKKRKADDLHSRAQFFMGRNDFLKALDLFDKSLGFNPTNPLLLFEAGHAAVMAGQFDKGASYLKRHLEQITKDKGANSRELSNAFNNTGMVYMNAGRHADSIAYFTRSLEIDDALSDPPPTESVGTLNNLALSLKKLERFDEAEALYVRANTLLEFYEKMNGESYKEQATVMDNLANLYSSTQRNDEALATFEKALAESQRTYGPEHEHTAIVLGNLGNHHLQMNNYIEAKALFKRSLNIFKAELGDYHFQVGIAMDNLSAVFREQGYLSTAEKYGRKGLEILENSRGPQHPNTKASARSYANILEKSGRPGDAAAVREKFGI